MRSLTGLMVPVITESNPETLEIREEYPGINEPASPLTVDSITPILGAMR